jgi:hypothetical protein
MGRSIAYSQSPALVLTDTISTVNPTGACKRRNQIPQPIKPRNYTPLLLSSRLSQP